MPDPLPKAKVEEIKRLLDLNTMTDSAIARESSASRATVKRIRTGEYRDGATGPRPRRRGEFEIVEAYTCEGCHLKVIYRPCLVCAALKRKGK